LVLFCFILRFYLLRFYFCFKLFDRTNNPSYSQHDVSEYVISEFFQDPLYSQTNYEEIDQEVVKLSTNVLIPNNLQKEVKHQNSHRILSLDFLRGCGIISIVILHSVIFNLFGDTTSASSRVPTTVQFLLLPIIIIGSWASLFALISGASLTYSIYKELIQKKRSPKKRLYKSLIRFFLLLVLHYIYSFFFIHPSKNIMGETEEGLVPGSIKEKKWKIPSFSIVYVTSAFVMLAFSDLLTSLFLLFLWYKQSGKKNKQNSQSKDDLNQEQPEKDHQNLAPKRNSDYFKLVAMGCFFIFLTPYIQTYLNPIMILQFEGGNYGLAMVLTWLVGINHCVFPFVGYAFFGAVFGLALAEKRKFEEIKQFVLPIAWGFLFISVYAFAQIDLMEFMGNKSPVQPFPLYTLNLSLQLFLMVWLVGKLDYSKGIQYQNYAEKTIGFRRWGMMSLTFFLFEYTISVCFNLIMNLIFPGITQSLFMGLMIWAPLYVYLMWKLVKNWEKNYFRYSLEWYLAKPKKKPVTQSNSEKKVAVPLRNPAKLAMPNVEDYLKIEKIIYLPAGLTSREYHS
jgi:hypothetical protein